ncbi:hypothetical protein HNP52_003356 [Sphingomonas kyeonggiensis]|uniref:Uncharacterized protein n=1 Tax=Sphingomonas kyeonggiensis TaxID=1268553 RepID=A0A7W7K3C5_9SPHN|nr:hypothetical protein [Sphingomonas kyeonggiensis]MBB4840264.1 hypothetical protein [Sphingomonas kyeonggiensis]
MKKMMIAAALIAFGTGIAQAQDVPQDARIFTDASGFRAEETPGGYQPASSSFSGPVTPTTQVVFVPQTLTPSQAYPAPAPLKAYPACKPGREDNCRQRQ